MGLPSQPPTPTQTALGPDGGHDLDARGLSDVEVDRRIRGGWDAWCDLLDDLLNTGGMLPSPRLAARTVAFFEGEYWRAEEARIEALRRQLTSRQNRHRLARGKARELG